MSQFVVSARKYRPVRFDEVVGQEHVGQTLKNAIRQDTLAHAFLFCGPRGVGKTTCARILAKLLNCTNVTKDTEPCNDCESCQSFDRAASMNIIELDAASNNSVDHIRSLNEQVRFQPQEGTYKVFIIDEVHMLSSAAFNAFLKTLEEPPPYAIFILATTEKHKIIPTILSRCQIFDFRRISVSDISQHLTTLCKSEGVSAEEEAIHLIATKADGALRDALSIFDKLASYGDKKITYQSVVQNLNVLDHDYFFKILNAFLLGDVANVLQIFDEIYQKGFESDAFLNGFAEHLRNLLVCHHKSIHHLLEITDQLKEQYLAQAEITGEDFILSALDIVNDCDVNYRMAKNKRLHVELALIKINFSKHINPAAPPVDQTEKKTEPVKNIAVLTRSSDSSHVTGTIVSEEMDTPEETLEKMAESSENEIKQIEGDLDEKPEVRDNLSNETAAKPFVLKRESSHTAINSLDKFVQAVEKKYEERRELEASPITLDQVQQIWDKYCREQSSPTVRTVLEKTSLDVVNNSILATVGTHLAKSVILQEVDLIDCLRASLGDKLVFKIEIDDTQQEDAKPRILTTKEKFEYLCSKNPQMRSFLQTFGLRPE